ncbi:TraR/DksA family transcriptional regulator [Shewanella sp. WXL01]|uniref:TraR/DksA C4-type zinc finger protein n=1 Tax=Shewanella sp. WXL01 TaxID=2709721 RepID=UPI00143867CA|nr:TraR/DksA C4-type zinc finger protein [Shewanella sp. WXL01]NKF51377.1 TraR/DksA family transcriptional regulator [Shewanella sp. WXL01]
MTDVIDKACELEQRQRDSAIKRQLQHTAHHGNDWQQRTCIDCYAPIGTERLVLVPNAKRCIECQLDYEHEQKKLRGKRG